VLVLHKNLPKTKNPGNFGFHSSQDLTSGSKLYHHNITDNIQQLPTCTSIFTQYSHFTTM